MKLSKKLIAIIPTLGLFLSGCSFADAGSWLNDHVASPVTSLFGGKKEEEKSGGDNKPAGGQSSDESEPRIKEVNPNWPTDDLAEMLEYYEVNALFPGYTGESDEIKIYETSEGGYLVGITVPEGKTEEEVLAIYKQDILDAGYKEKELIGSDMSYASPNGELIILPYCGSEVDDSGYVLIVFATSTSGGGDEDTDVGLKDSTEFPKSAVDKYLEDEWIEETDYPIPDGSSFKHGEDEESWVYLVYVFDGSSDTYMSQLVSHGFEKDDYYYEEYGYYVFTKNDLEIDVAPYDTDDNENFYCIAFGYNWGELFNY